MSLQFEPITLERQTAYSALLATCPHVTSDYSFINLWGWADEYGLQWAWTDAVVWIKQTRPKEIHWAPVGPWENIDWTRELNGNFSGNREFIRVPENALIYWKASFKDRMTAESSRGHWDYIYDTSELIALKGNRFHKKKNLVNQFVKKHTFSYTPLKPDLIEHALNLQTDWCTWRDCESFDTLASENRTIQKILLNWNDISGITGGALLVDDAMVAYTVAERLTDNMLLVHFEKANPDYKGVYQAINQMFLSHSDATVQTVNREQDLDDEGLRKAKLSYHPIDFLKKYHVNFS